MCVCVNALSQSSPDSLRPNALPGVVGVWETRAWTARVKGQGSFSARSAAAASEPLWFAGGLSRKPNQLALTRVPRPTPHGRTCVDAGKFINANGGVVL